MPAPALRQHSSHSKRLLQRLAKTGGFFLSNKQNGRPASDRQVPLKSYILFHAKDKVRAEPAFHPGVINSVCSLLCYFKKFIQFTAISFTLSVNSTWQNSYRHPPQVSPHQFPRELEKSPTAAKLGRAVALLCCVSFKAFWSWLISS